MSDDVFDMVIEFKDPDGCQQFAYWADEDAREAAIARAMEEQGLPREDVEDQVLNAFYDSPERASKRFFKWGEYGSLEVFLKKDGTGTCRLIPNDE